MGAAARRGRRRRGPLAGEHGYDPPLQFAGLISVTGEPDRPGVRIGTSVIDFATGVWAALGVVSALHERHEAGRGRAVDVALFETALSLVGYQLTDVLATGRVAGRDGTAFPFIVPYEVFATADGELMMAAGNDGLFAQLCRAADLTHLVGDPRFRTNVDRIEHRDALRPLIAARLREQTTAFWLDALAGIPVAPVHDLSQVAAHEQTSS